MSANDFLKDIKTMGIRGWFAQKGDEIYTDGDFPRIPEELFVKPYIDPKPVKPISTIKGRK